MTSAAFQGAVAQLVVDRASREHAADESAFVGLTPAERDQIRRLARDPGLLLTAQLVASFRLGKLLTLLPITRAVLGNDQLAIEVDLFWRTCPPVSFYLPDEALAFCDHLERRIESGQLSVTHLTRAVALERSEILGRRPGATLE